MADVCEGPGGDGVVSILTTTLDAWEFIEDPYERTTLCEWELGIDGHLRQSANSTRTQGILPACNAIAVNQTYTDVMLQVDVNNDDNDAVGINFEWEASTTTSACTRPTTSGRTWLRTTSTAPGWR